PAAEPRPDQAKPDQDGPDEEGQRGAQDEPRYPHVGPADHVQADREAQDGEGNDLGEAGQRRVEPLGLPLVRGAPVAEHDPGGEHREEPRPVRERRDGEQQQRAGQGPQRVQAFPGQRHPPHEPQQRGPARHADSRAHPHLEQELPADTRPAAVRLAIRAIPTGSLAPDSPFKMVSPRTETSRCPRTENTTAGSVGATAVASSTEAYQGRPNAACASTAVAATVRNVPATPVTVTGTAADRNRDQPICIPPSNKMHTSATVTSRST